MPHWVSSGVDALAASATEELDNRVKSMGRAGVADIISLGVGEPCFDTPGNIKRATCRALEDGKTKYEPTAGDYELREAIAEKLHKRNNIKVGANSIVVTAGAKFAIFLAFQATVGPGDRVMILDPAWVTYEPAARITGGGVKRVPCPKSNGFQPDFDLIKRALDESIKIVVINSPCNPTGAVYTPDVIRDVVKLAHERGVLVLSDECYEVLVYDAEHYSPASDFDNVITVNAFSKSHAMTGWRLGYATGPQDVIDGMLKVYQHSTSCVTAFTQPGGVEALRSAESQEAVQQMVAGYEARRSVMLELIRESGFLECGVEPQGAFYCFPEYQGGMPSSELAAELLERCHVATVPGSAFGESGEGHLRLSYATEIPLLKEAFGRLKGFFEGKRV